MRKSGSILSFFFVQLLLVSSCYNRTSPEQTKRTPSYSEKDSAKIEFLSEMHNFGTLKAGEIVSYSFIFKNSGNKPVKVKEVVRSCDCITANFQDKEIKPGERSEIEITLSTAGEWGNLLKTVEVSTGESKNKILTIIAYIEDEQINNLLKKEK